METLTTERPATDAAQAAAVPATREHRVSTDARIGGAVLAVAIGGHLLWSASDGGVLSAIGLG